MDRKKQRDKSRFFTAIYLIWCKKKKNYLFCNFKFEKKCINIKKKSRVKCLGLFLDTKKAPYLDNWFNFTWKYFF